MKILVTGCAGFIGYHLCNKLLDNKKNIVYGIDNLNNYYDIKLKKNRINLLKKKSKNFKYSKKDIKDLKILRKFFFSKRIKYIIHLAAQAGVRYSIYDPSTYLNNNVIGFFNILQISRIFKINHLLFASTSSVYGLNKKFPIAENYNTDKPLSFYAATKKTNEVMAHSFSNIYKIPCTALRFFTVYGPYGRPDMSLFKFTEAIFKSKKIELFNRGDHIRDFTYIDDVIISVEKLINKPSKNLIPYDVFNIGSSRPKHLKFFLRIIEKTIGKKTHIKLMNLQKGDVYKTHANVNKLSKFINYKPRISVNRGVKNFVEWYIKFYNKK